MTAQDPVVRIRRGLLVLLAVSVLSICGRKIVSGGDWLSAAYWYVITVSSVGFSERSNLQHNEQFFTILVIIVGMSVVGYTLGGLIQLVTEGEIERALGVRKMTRQIESLSDHVIVCGFGRMGQNLAADLQRHGRDLVVIDRDVDRATDAQDRGFPALAGDATEEATLMAVGIEKAYALVSGLPSDAENVFIVLTSRNLNPKLRIIARAEQPNSESKLLQAGADAVVLPSVLGARRMAHMVTHPHTAELLDRVVHSQLDAALDELKLREDTSLVGRTVREAETKRQHKLLVVSVSRSDGEIIFNPDADYVFCAGDTIVVMGHVDDIQRFRGTFDL